MARTKRTARRAFLGGGPTTGLRRYDKDPLLLLPGSTELPDALVKYMSEADTVPEPPRKRRKMVLERKMGETSSEMDDSTSEKKELDHVILKQTTMEIRCIGSKLGSLDLPRTRNIETFLDNSNRYEPEPEYIMIYNSAGEKLVVVPLPESPVEREDVRHALAAARLWKTWAKEEGKLWSDLELTLFRKDEADQLQLTFTIKWNVTETPEKVVPLPSKVPRLSNVISAYFHDSSATFAATWSAQDFYQCVSPAEDESAAALNTEELEPTLYPFQKKAVQWLLRREGVELADGRIQEAQSGESGLPSSFIETKDAKGKKCYVSHAFGLVTLDVRPFLELERGLTGGILAEEMGLGKTIEMMALITLHKRPMPMSSLVYDAYIGDHIRPTGASLIITPPAILQQWISEINSHAPRLKVFHYEGIKAHNKINATDLLETLASSDIVVTTYAVLAAEIHFTKLNPEKSLRRESKYPRPKSPLMLLSWWRVCIDEAQLLQSGVSNAATVARMLPRINSWGVSGTPIAKDFNDLHGLLIFLRYEPYASTKHVWSSLISTHKSEFSKLFSSLALRHSKQSVRDELKLPAQRRYVITMPFTPIEEQHYQELFTQMCEESGLDNTGAPVRDDWDPADYADIMRGFLVRLRQTALHPEVGGRNRRALGKKDGPLRTVDEVLDAMMDQTDLAIRSDQRALLVSKLRRGQLFENSPRVQEALDLWPEVVSEASTVVEECREQVRLEIMKTSTADQRTTPTAVDNSDTPDFQDNADADPSSSIGILRTRLRSALEIEHMATFFSANAYFQIKSNEEMTQPDSDKFKELEALETNHYELAKKMRREILQEIFRKADRLMKNVSKRARTQAFVQIPEFASTPPKGGIQSHRIIEQLDELGAVLDLHANQLDEWREQTIQFLLCPLVDEDEGIEITGDEYEDSTKTQDEVMVYVQALRAVIADRYDALTGQNNLLIDFDVKIAIRTAQEGKGPFPEKTLELLQTRQAVKPPQQLGSVRAIVAELRALATSLRPDAESGNNRAQSELSIVEAQLKVTQKQWSEQIKSNAALEKEVELFTNVMNTRLEYYRQLQQVSDMVAPYEGPNNEEVLANMLETEDKLANKIATSKSKRRYLLHLKVEAVNPQEQRTCVICRESIEVGALTVCGHQFCKECIRHWWAAHRTCPVCKKKLKVQDLHDMTYKPQELSIQTEEVNEQRTSASSSSRKSAIFSEISKSKLAEIKNIELDGPLFTTKVDTLARHLIWLRESDPGSKSIIYSQFKDFLNVLARAFQRFRIGFSSIDKPNGIEKFKQDPGIECFLLHSRAHSSGLNLVNASHVFLCEPLLNTALELQAIARVDRIGQHQETNVWLYLIDGTVEESIHQLSVKRRLEHIGQTLKKSKGKNKERTPEALLDANLEEANSMEMQQASLANLLTKGSKGGEKVENEDLWECLFGATRQKSSKGIESLTGDKEVRRHLAAESAEKRLVLGS